MEELKELGNKIGEVEKKLHRFFLLGSFVILLILLVIATGILSIGNYIGDNNMALPLDSKILHSSE